jgi:hypothetical protein
MCGIFHQRREFLFLGRFDALEGWVLRKLRLAMRLEFQHLDSIELP